jgi:hypothetical protein
MACNATVSARSSHESSSTPLSWLSALMLLLIFNYWRSTPGSFEWLKSQQPDDSIMATKGSARKSRQKSDSQPKKTVWRRDLMTKGTSIE